MNGANSGTPTRISGAQAFDCKRIFLRWSFFKPSRLRFAAKPMFALFWSRRRLRCIRYRNASPTGQLAVLINPCKAPENLHSSGQTLWILCNLFEGRQGQRSIAPSLPFLTISIARTLALCDNLCGCPCHVTLTGRAAAEGSLSQPLRPIHRLTIASCTCALLDSCCPWY